MPFLLGGGGLSPPLLLLLSPLPLPLPLGGGVPPPPASCGILLPLSESSGQVPPLTPFGACGGPPLLSIGWLIPVPFCLSCNGTVTIPPPVGGGVLPPPGAVAIILLLLGISLNFNSGLSSLTEANHCGSKSNSREVSELESSSSPSLE